MKTHSKKKYKGVEYEIKVEPLMKNIGFTGYGIIYTIESNIVTFLQVFPDNPLYLIKEELILSLEKKIFIDIDKGARE